MPVRFIDHVELLRSECRRKLLLDACLHGHGRALGKADVGVNGVLHLAEIASVKT
jgi:hypothetical protein